MKKTDHSQDCAVQYWWNQDLNISQQQTNALSFILKDVVSYLCYAQHSQRYLRQAPHTHKGTWKICGCLYNCTSAVHKTVCQKQDVQLHKQKSSHTLQNMSNCQLAKGWGVDKKTQQPKISSNCINGQSKLQTKSGLQGKREPFAHLTDHQCQDFLGTLQSKGTYVHSQPVPCT